MTALIALGLFGAILLLMGAGWVAALGLWLAAVLYAFLTDVPDMTFVMWLFLGGLVCLIIDLGQRSLSGGGDDKKKKK